MTHPDDSISTRLHELPPALPDPGDRFEQLERRVRAHRRRVVATAGACAAALVVVASGAVLALRPSDDPSDGRGVDPASTGGPSPHQRSEAPTDNRPRVHTGTGTQTLGLGPRPRGMDAVSMSVACFAPGRISWPDTATFHCYADQVSTPEDPEVVSWYDMALAAGQDSVTITAPRHMRWQVTTVYVPKAG